MVIGFTDTSKGMTPYQKQRVDTEFHRIACPLNIHPPDNDSKRAFNQSGSILPVKPYLDRNNDIVNMSDMLITTPETAKKALRSGTWSTVQYPKRAGNEVILCNPVHLKPNGTLPVNAKSRAAEAHR